jgi:hypothetical protein
MKKRFSQILFLLLVFTFNAVAQKTAKTNPSIFILQEDLKKMKLFVSTQKDVEKIFGKNCNKYCPYNEDWLFYFDYANDRYTYSESLNKYFFYQPKKEYRGKLININLVTGISLPDSFFANENLKCVKNKTFAGGNTFNSTTCEDNKGLNYFIIDEMQQNGKTYKNRLQNIRLSLPIEKYNEIFVLEKSLSRTQ